MTESEWLTSDDPMRMLGSCKAWVWITDTYRPSDRKLRLFACACARSVGWGGPGHWCNLHIDKVEAWADGRTVEPVQENTGGEVRMMSLHFAPEESARFWADNGWQSHHRGDGPTKAAILRDIIGNPFRGFSFVGPGGAKITVGPPLPNPAALRQLGQAWIDNPIVQSIARIAYDDRDFGVLPVMADALEEAGCDNEELLRHLRWEKSCWHCHGTRKVPVQVLKDGARPNSFVDVDCQACADGWECSPEPHIRGCWALDLILGKE